MAYNISICLFDANAIHSVYCLYNLFNFDNKPLLCHTSIVFLFTIQSKIYPFKIRKASITHTGCSDRPTLKQVTEQQT